MLKGIQEKNYVDSQNCCKGNCGALNIKQKCDVPKEYRLGDPSFIDPLYRPYQTDYSKSPYLHPGVINTGYPLVDPYRRFLGRGLNHRSQHEGICPPGYRSGARNECILLEPESFGMFYTNEYSKTMLDYSNCKMPYNADACNFKNMNSSNGAWQCNASPAYEKAKVLEQDVLGMNGYDNKYPEKIAKCMTQYFW